MKKNIALIGPMCAGKSFIGEQLAQHLNFQFIDIDHEVEFMAGMTVQQLFKHQGEAAFRLLEEEALAKVLGTALHTVISTGGGCVLAKKNRELIVKSSWIVYLKVSANVALVRCESSKKVRPLLLEGNPLTRWEAIAQERKPHYETLADIVLDTDHALATELVAQIVEAWGRGVK